MTFVIFPFVQPPPAQYLRNKSLAASRRHVAASYWTAASDVAPTSAPSTMVAGGRPPLTIAAPPLTTTGQPLTVARPPLTTTIPPVNSGW
nr:hypothetical protein [Tanacetum cinerariifolium]